MHAESDNLPARKLYFPKESGAWGVLLETGLIGLLAVYSPAAVWATLALVAMFFARQPVRHLMKRSPAYRSQVLTALALTAIPALACLTMVIRLAGPTPLAPLIIVAIFGGWQLREDVRHRGRKLIPQLAGALGMTAAVMMIVRAGGGSWQLAFVLWLLLVLRQWLTIPLIRGLIRHQRSRPGYLKEIISLQLVVTVLAVILAMIKPGWAPFAGVCCLLAVRALWRGFRCNTPVPAVVLGFSEMAIGVIYAIVVGLTVPPLFL